MLRYLLNDRWLPVFPHRWEGHFEGCILGPHVPHDAPLVYPFNWPGQEACAEVSFTSECSYISDKCYVFLLNVFLRMLPMNISFFTHNAQSNGNSARLCSPSKSVKSKWDFWISCCSVARSSSVAPWLQHQISRGWLHRWAPNKNMPPRQVTNHLFWLLLVSLPFSKRSLIFPSVISIYPFILSSFFYGLLHVLQLGALFHQIPKL